jgi:predicted GNAT family acetyltransferase
MQVRRYDDPAGFAEAIAPLLLRAPARHNLMLGILDLLRRRPEVYPTFHLWAALDGEAVVGAALRTPPHNLVVAEPTVDAAVDDLAEAIARDGDRPPGVVGAVPEVERFADSWTERLGGTSQPSTRQGVYELTRVRDHGDAPGEPRRATAEDLDLLATWNEEFIAEAAPDHVGDPGMRRRRMQGAVADGEYWLWEDEGRPVSLTGVTPTPPRSARVGPVYTPPAERRRGYATALVAHASAEQLRAGADSCCLHTDLANPTSNEIYRQIGYEWVCEAVDLRFVGQSQFGGVGA